MNEMSIGILTERRFHPGGAHHIIYEWEDILCKELKASMRDIPPLWINKWENRIRRILHFHIIDLFVCHKYYIKFMMYAMSSDNMWNSPYIIPYIIDFYIPKDNLQAFFDSTCRNKYVFVSSMEAFVLLQKHPLFDKKKYYHVPLSISDKYSIYNNTKFCKKYDCAMLGRSDNKLMSFVDRYASLHPEFTYVTRDVNDDVFTYYLYSGGRRNILCTGNAHDIYLDIMKSCKVGLWSTRGLEDLKCNGYNQVTPRLFELMISGCQIIARYPLNPDIEYYNVHEICPSIEDYSAFEKRLDIYLAGQIDIISYCNYLSQHYTSVRAKQIKKYIETFKLSCKK